MSIFALKVSEDMRNPVFEELNNAGVARFTWSYSEEGNLETISGQIQEKGWNTLTDNQKECWKANFLLNIKPEDYIVYINVPNYGECTIAKVTEKYYWDWEKYKGDGSHCIKIDINTVKTFNRNNENIPSNLSRRFKLQGKYWKIYLEEEFFQLVQDLENGNFTDKNATIESRLTNCINFKVKPYLDEICKELQKAHSGKHLEELIQSILEDIPNVTNIERKSGSSDKGGDIIFNYVSEFGDIFGLGVIEEKIAIQVKSYEETIDHSQAITDLKNVFNFDPELTTGIIMTTAIDVSEKFNNELDRLKEDTKKNISIIYGKDFANWILKYGYKKFK